jgi:SgrR family transcriptional regulator
LLVRAHFPDRLPQEIALTIDELCGLLTCTRQNVKLLLHKWSDQGWVSWYPGRGRGHYSRIRFHRQLREHLMELAIRQIRSGNIQSAHDLVRKYGARDGFKAAWTAWMSTQFGWRQEVTDGGNEDVLRLPYYRPIGALDPLNSQLRTDAHWVKQVFDTLVEWDAERHQAVPHLALEWDCDESGRQWVFYLRKGVHFHHGAELTSEDVVYSLNRLRMSGDRSDYWALLIREIAPLGPLAVSITLKEPNSLFLHVLASPRFSIAAKDHKPLIGSGPFTIEEQTKERFVLKAFAGYFQGRPQLDTIELWITDSVPDDSMYVPLKAAASKQPEYKCIRSKENGACYLLFNSRKFGPQQHPAFRRALALILDRARLVQSLGSDRFAPATGFHPSSMVEEAWEAPDLLELEGLLNQAGYRGETLRLRTYSVSDGAYERSAQAIAAQCEPFGIRMKAEISSRQVFHSSTADAELLLMGVVAGDDWGLFLHQMIRSDIGLWKSYLPAHTKEELEKHLEQVLMNPDGIFNVEAIRQMDVILQEEHAVLCLYHNIVSTVIHRRLRGVKLSSSGWLQFKDVWLSPRETQ